MLDLDLAQQLRAAGLPWEPAPGDRFVLPLPDMQDEVFILSNVIAEVHQFEHGNVIGFNGTTEWALDSVEQDGVVWLPREEQLRELLGAAFVRLEPVTGGYRRDGHRRGRRGPPVRRHRRRAGLRARRAVPAQRVIEIALARVW